MEERLDDYEDQPAEQDNQQQNTRGSLGELNNIQIELQDFKDAEYPKHIGSVEEAEEENNVVMFGKVGNKDVSRKLKV